MTTKMLIANCNLGNADVLQELELQQEMVVILTCNIYILFYSQSFYEHSLKKGFFFWGKK